MKSISVSPKNVHSFKDLQALFPNMKSNREDKSHKCRICGADMEHIAGSNVWICHGTIEVPKPTDKNPNAKELQPCANYILSKY